MSKRMGLSMMAELNPLAQHFTEQMSKLGSTSTSSSTIKSVLSKSLPNDVGPFAAYFKHGAFVNQGKWMAPGAELAGRVAGTRKMAGVTGGSWVGLNVLDSESNITKTVNYLGITAGGLLAGGKLGPKVWSHANKLGGSRGFGVKAGAIMLGAAFAANRLGII